MTDNERVLHTILSTVRTPYHPEGQTDTTREEQMMFRLEEIAIFAEEQILINAKRNIQAKLDKISKVE